MDKHTIVSALKKLASDLGRIPKRDEFTQVCPKASYYALGLDYSDLLAAAGFLGKKKEPPFKFKFKRAQLESFTVFECEIDQIFKALGNPPSVKLIAMPDTHVKHRDHAAVRAFLKFIKWYDPDVFIILGDFLDAEDISHWEDPSLEPRQFAPEIKEARKLLKEISDATPNCIARFFLEGNHEDWINQAIAQKMPNFFFGLEEFGLTPDLKKLLDLEGFGYELVKLNTILKFGHAHFTHGLYTGNGHAKKHLDRLKANIYYGHLHDTFSHHDSSLGGIIESGSLGCLCRLDAKFMKGKPTNWVHAFGIFEFFPDGTYTLVVPKIIRGRLSFAGKVFSGV